MISDWLIVATAILPGARWAKVTDGALSYTWANEVYVRTLSPALAFSPPVQVNQTTYGIQDEPEITRLANGNYVVAWSDRSGLLSGYMMACARVFSPALVPLTGQVNLSTTLETAWRPLLSPDALGGFVAAWTERWNEDAVWGRFDDLGASQGPPAALHAPSGSSQNSPAVAPLRGGVAWAYIDAANTPFPRDAVTGWSMAGGAVGRSRQHVQPGTAWEARVASNGRFAAATWINTDLNEVWAKPFLGAPTFLGCGRDAEVALTAEGLVVWDCGDAIMAQRLDLTGALDGQPWALVSGLALMSAGEVGRRQCDVWLAPDATWGLVCFGEVGGVTRVVRIERP